MLILSRIVHYKGGSCDKISFLQQVEQMAQEQFTKFCKEVLLLTEHDERCLFVICRISFRLVQGSSLNLEGLIRKRMWDLKELINHILFIFVTLSAPTAFIILLQSSAGLTIGKTRDENLVPDVFVICIARACE